MDHTGTQRTDDSGDVDDGSHVGRPPVNPVDIRRAVLGHMLRHRAPMNITDVITALRDKYGARAGVKQVSDLLRHQSRLGRVRRVRRGVYEAVPEAFPKSTAWRCLNWELERTRRERRDEWVGVP